MLFNLIKKVIYGRSMAFRSRVFLTFIGGSILCIIFALMMFFEIGIDSSELLTAFFLFISSYFAINIYYLMRHIYSPNNLICANCKLNYWFDNDVAVVNYEAEFFIYSLTLWDCPFCDEKAIPIESKG